jgi:hypothetical protein
MTICRVIQVRDLGGNAVLGYQLHFDMKGDSGIPHCVYYGRILPCSSHHFPYQSTPVGAV